VKGALLVRRLTGGCAAVLVLVLLPFPSLGKVAARAGVERVSLAAGDGAVRRAERFDLIGLSWPADEDHPHGELRVRYGNRWSDWVDVHAHGEEGPDPASREAQAGRSSSPPIWVGGADAFQVRSEGPVTTHLVRDRKPSASPLSALSDRSAAALVARPEIRTRGEWVAREPKAAPSYGRVQVGFVHHTVGTNDYSAEQVPGLIRGIQAYHMDSNGWDDIGYNFLVDRFGRVWEGRGGGIERSVIGAHAGGFNTNSTGVAILGTFTEVAPTTAATQAVSRFLSWKLPHHGSDPAGQTRVESKGSSRYSAGTMVTLSNVSGHRDVSTTSCPGQLLYNRLGQIQAEAAAGAAVTVPYSEAWKGGTFVAAGDFDNDGVDEIATGADSGGGPHVRTFEPDGAGRKSFIVYPQGFRGGVRVAAGNVDGLGGAELITAAGPGGGPHVRILRNETEGIGSFMAYTPGFTGGVYLATGNVDGIPGDEIITGAGAGGGPHIRIFKSDGTAIGGFFGFSPAFPGGVRVGTADIDGDGRDEIVAGAGPGGGPHVRIFDMTGRVLGSFFAYAQSFQGGVNVGSVSSDASLARAPEWIVTGAGEGGGPHLRVLTVTGEQKGSFFAGRPTDKGGVRIAGGVFTPRVDPDAGVDEPDPTPEAAIVTGAGPKDTGLVKIALPTGRLIFP
jgi:hypothetical protein